MSSLEKYKDQRIHFIGIGGCSMSGLAMILKSRGYTISGSDQRESSFTETLTTAGIPYTIGHDAKNVDDAGLVIFSAAIRDTNPEFSAAKAAGIPMLERSELLGLISGEYYETVAIAGCHGKTTITSMLGMILEQFEFVDPTVHVGGIVDRYGCGVRLGSSGSVFVTEACEFNRSFLKLSPLYAVVNNIDDDHLDCYSSIDEIQSTFVEFIKKLPKNGLLFINGDDPRCVELSKHVDCMVIPYGFGEGCLARAVDVEYDENGCGSFSFFFRSRTWDYQGRRIELSVPGRHNVMNALAAVAVAFICFAIRPDEAADALKDYHLTERRFQHFGDRNGIRYVHDYAHHPTEIAACLEGARMTGPKRLIALFQCNSYTRARTLLEKYGKCFSDADIVLMPDIFPGRDIDTGGMTSERLFEEISKNHPNVHHIPTFEEIRLWLDRNGRPGDLVVTLGSGDVNKQQFKLV